MDKHELLEVMNEKMKSEYSVFTPFDPETLAGQCTGLARLCGDVKSAGGIEKFYHGYIMMENIGICGNILCDYIDWDVDNRLADELITAITLTWPKFSGDTSYPVPHPNYPGRPTEAYQQTNDLYVGEYGENRYQYFAYLVETLEILFS